MNIQRKRVRDNFTSQVYLVRSNYIGCLDLIMGRAMAMRGEQGHRERKHTIHSLLPKHKTVVHPCEC